MNTLYAAWAVSVAVIVGVILWGLWSDIRQTPLDPIPPMPTKDGSKSNEEQGLYQKFFVNRVDGSDEPGGKHEGCEYFVLDLNHDPYAIETLAYYAYTCKATHPLLYRDLMARVNAKFDQMDEKGLL